MSLNKKCMMQPITNAMKLEINKYEMYRQKLQNTIFYRNFSGRFMRPPKRKYVYTCAFIYVCGMTTWCYEVALKNCHI